MDFKTQNNSQQSTPASQHAAHAGGPNHSNSPKAHRGLAKLLGLLSILLVIVAIVIGAAFVYKSKAPTAPDANRFQAVFMTNGQVYFGKMTKLGSKYTELAEVYYLQVQQSVQPSTDNKAPEATATDSSQVSLTKLGNELHGPTDKMNISNDQVLFWEDLKDDSTVVKAIKDYETK